MDSTTSLNRKSNYDLLRILATIAVIIIHANFHFFINRYETPILSIEYSIESFLNIITRFSVPVFVMLSGAFNLNNPKNGDAIFFYKKITWKIGWPTFLAMLIFLLIDETYNLLFGKGIKTILESAMSILLGGYALWYLFVLIWIYLVTPLLIKLKNNISIKSYRNLGIGLMIFAILSQSISEYKISYTLGTACAFLAYYILGDLLINSKTKRIPPVLCLLISIAMVGITWYIRYKGFILYTYVTYRNFFSPTIVVISIFVILFFKQVKISFNLSYLSRITFYMYLFHSIVLNGIYTMFMVRYFETINELLAILIATIITIIMSLLIAIIADKIWMQLNILKQKWYSARFWDKL